MPRFISVRALLFAFVAGEYLGISKDGWDIVFGFGSTLGLVIGLGITVHQLRLGVAQRSYELLNDLHRRLDEHAADIKKVIDGSAETDVQRRVINLLNSLAQQIEAGAIDARAVLGLSSPTIMRLVGILEPFRLAEEIRSRSRYGRRLHRLDAAARSYHDSVPHLRHETVYATVGGLHTVLHQTVPPANRADRLRAHVRWWWLRRRGGWYRATEIDRSPTATAPEAAG